MANLKQIIDGLEAKFPDTHPRKLVEPFELGYQAGALEIIRRLKEVENGDYF